MQRRPVASSVIAAVGCDEPTSVLEIESCNAAVHHDFMVAPSVHRELLVAPSIGREFQARVRNRCRSARVR